MPQQLCNGALLQCSMGMAPSGLTVLPVNRVNTGNQPDANIMDNVPLENILPFGMCMSPANPAVAAATAWVLIHREDVTTTWQLDCRGLVSRW
jgi:hypothetical protein